MRIFTSADLYSVIKERHLFIDTCLLLDVAHLNKRERGQLWSILTSFKKVGGVFVTLVPIATEFFLGSNIEDLKIKRDYFNALIEAILPVRTISQEVFDQLIIEYGNYAKGKVSYPDLCLAAAAKQFRTSLLVTRNHKDFPLKIFDCLGVLVIHLNNEARCYGFYQYKGQGSTQ